MLIIPELVDEILNHLRHDERALRNCSLVARSWTYPSQKLIYTHIRITPSTFRTWQKIASPTSAELLRHVYSLTCSNFNSLYGFHRGYLKSFYHLQRLTVEQVDDVGSNTVNLFQAFQSTLSSLSLLRVSLTLDAFIGLLGYFPNLRSFHLNKPAFYPEYRTVPPPSIPPRGTLALSMVSAKDADILLGALCKLELEYDELGIFGVSDGSSHINSLLSACEKTLTRLKLGSSDCKPHTQQLHEYRLTHCLDPPAGSTLTLKNPSELRELVFDMSLQRLEEVSLISTITSTSIRKIVFSPSLSRDLREQFWSSLDTELSSLVDRLRRSGYKHTLELEVRHQSDFAEKVPDAGPDAFLPKFREKGRVTISEVGSGRILYCSDGLLRSGLDS